jgi:hypothetical protein
MMLSHQLCVIKALHDVKSPVECVVKVLHDVKSLVVCC